MDKNAFKNGSDYEIFMRRAFREHDYSKPGMHRSVMENLISVENGDTTFQKQHGSFEKQLLQTKIFMHQAIDKYIKMRTLSKETKESLTTLKNAIDLSHSSDELMSIIETTIDLTKSVKDY
jgi:hypothetical protein